MAARLRLRVLTPARQVLLREVDSANLPAAEGEVGILPGHAAFLAFLRPGVASFKDGAATEYLAVSDGFVEVNEDVVTALVRSAEPAGEIDVARAEKRRAEREAELKRASLSELEMKEAEASLQKQVARIHVGRLAG